MSTKTWPPFRYGTRVKTTKPNMKKREGWTPEAWKERKWGVRGEIVGHHDSHGLCYTVRHEDGTVGYYDSSELKVFKNK